MREIKFRQWDFSKKVWHYFEFKDGSCSGVMNASISLYPIMQYTGLKDKNGVEVYEGDIIKNPQYEEPHVVEYAENLAGYVGWGDDRICGCYLITDEDIEIIGNIHENPELLENN